MGKPDAIPQDVEAAASQVLSELLWNEYDDWAEENRTVIARAILDAKAEEREACLNEISMIAGSPVSASAALRHAFAAIRKRGEG